MKSFPEKRSAEAAVRRLAGVKAVAEDLAVKLGAQGCCIRNGYREVDIGRLGRKQFGSCRSAEATFESGWATLKGEVEWQFQRKLAEVRSGTFGE